MCESGLAEHLFDFLYRNVSFDQAQIVNTSIGLLQSFREIIEIKKKYLREH